ncbi:hypothetical protein WMF31_22290 [Sorangium sp. So ce1036]|uniref:hypothetical protein n=1 Tax=Sorangium sp. So ce1036 TaxID=3133328 RepID=UPI003F049366
MSSGDAERAVSADTAAAIYNGEGLLQMLVWRCVFARYEAHLLDGLEELKTGLRRFMTRREQGLAQGGPERVTEDDIQRLERLSSLVQQWLAGGELSPEIEALARELWGVLADPGAGVEMLPPP